MKVDVFLDGSTAPIATIEPPETFNLDTNNLEDGEHRLEFVASQHNGVISRKQVTFFVHNGPEIVVHGLTNNDTVQGNISILANAYAANLGDEFEPVRIETPAPIPTWAWLLLLCVIAWGAGYISLEYHERQFSAQTIVDHSAEATSSNENLQGSEGSDWTVLGEQVYGNNCASCHQISGTGLAGVFPPLKGNPAVLDDDPTVHIQAILKGVSGKVIDGVAYASPMPNFSGLSDEEVAAVVNHERTQWGNDAKLVTPEDVSMLR